VRGIKNSYRMPSENMFVVNPAMEGEKGGRKGKRKKMGEGASLSIRFSTARGKKREKIKEKKEKGEGEREPARKNVIFKTLLNCRL